MAQTIPTLPFIVKIFSNRGFYSFKAPSPQRKMDAISLPCPKPALDLKLQVVPKGQLRGKKGY